MDDRFYRRPLDHPAQTLMSAPRKSSLSKLESDRTRLPSDQSRDWEVEECMRGHYSIIDDESCACNPGKERKYPAGLRRTSSMPPDLVDRTLTSTCSAMKVDHERSIQRSFSFSECSVNTFQQRWLAYTVVGPESTYAQQNPHTTRICSSSGEGLDERMFQCEDGWPHFCKHETRSWPTNMRNESMEYKSHVRSGDDGSRETVSPPECDEFGSQGHVSNEERNDDFIERASVVDSANLSGETRFCCSEHGDSDRCLLDFTKGLAEMNPDEQDSSESFAGEHESSDERIACSTEVEVDAGESNCCECCVLNHNCDFYHTSPPISKRKASNGDDTGVSAMVNHQHSRLSARVLPLKRDRIMRQVSDTVAVLPRRANTTSIQRRASLPDNKSLEARLKHPPLAFELRYIEYPMMQCTLPSCSQTAGSRYHSRGLQPCQPTRKASVTAQLLRPDSAMLQALSEDVLARVSSTSLACLSNTDLGPWVLTHPEPTQATRPSSPMSKVKSKLAAWSWARQQVTDEDEETTGSGPFRTCQRDVSQYSSNPDSPWIETIPAPPNSKQHSDASSTKPSMKSTSREESSSELDKDSSDLELRFRKSVRRSSSAQYYGFKNAAPPRRQRPSSIPASAVEYNRDEKVMIRFSDPPLRDGYFQSHRDSLELLRRHIAQGDKYGSRQLMESRNSIFLAQSKLHGKRLEVTVNSSSSATDDVMKPKVCKLGVSSFSNVPIPRTEVHASTNTDRSKCAVVEDEGDHQGCPICEVERPK